MTFLNSLLGRKDEPAEPAQSKAGIPTNVQNKVTEGIV